MKTYKSIDGMSVLQTGYDHPACDVLLVNRFGSLEEEAIGKAMRGAHVLFEGLETGGSKLGDDDNKVVIWYETEEDIRMFARFEPEPKRDVLDTLTRIGAWEYKHKRKVLFPRYPSAPVYVGANTAAVIRPRSFGDVSPRVLEDASSIEAEVGVKVIFIPSDEVGYGKADKVGPLCREAVEDFFRYYGFDVVNLLSGDITFGSEFLSNGDWAECVNIPIWHAGFYDEELLPAKQAIFRAFRRAFGYVPIIRYTFGS